MNQLSNIKHPLALDTKVRANKPICKCKGGGTTIITGTIKKIIPSQTGNWYYLDSNHTVQDSWIIEIL